MGEPAGVDRGPEGFEIGLPGQLGIQRLQPLRPDLSGRQQNLRGLEITRRILRLGRRQRPRGARSPGLG
jgi:hypothetical protein